MDFNIKDLEAYFESMKGENMPPNHPLHCILYAYDFDPVSLLGWKTMGHMYTCGIFDKGPTDILAALSHVISTYGAKEYDWQLSEHFKDWLITRRLEALIA